MSNPLTQGEKKFLKIMFESCKAIVQMEKVKGGRLALVVAAPVEDLLHRLVKEMSGNKHMVFRSMTVDMAKEGAKTVRLMELDNPFVSFIGVSDFLLGFLDESAPTYYPHAFMVAAWEKSDLWN